MSRPYLPPLEIVITHSCGCQERWPATVRPIRRRLAAAPCPACGLAWEPVTVVLGGRLLRARWREVA